MNTVSSHPAMEKKISKKPLKKIKWISKSDSIGSNEMKEREKEDKC